MSVDRQMLCQQLPQWVVVASWIATPLASCALGWFAIWLVDRCNRPALAGLHWTEQARRHAGGSTAVQGQVFIFAAVTGVTTYLLASGWLTTLPPLARALLAAAAVWLGGRVVHFYRARRALPWLTASDFWHGQLFVFFIIYPIPIVAIAMLLFGPFGWTEHEWRFVLVYGGGIATMLWLYFGGIIRLGRSIGIITPADERANSIVAAASKRANHPVDGVWLVRAPMANAAALPMSNEVLFTSHALAKMSDNELTAIMLHELGHLRESTRDRMLRGSGVVIFALIGFAKPLYELVGLGGLLIGFAIVVIASVLIARRLRGLETKADAHAQEHEHSEEAGSYARALERIYELNLAPAVTAGRGRTHPHLYDRLVAAGVTPDYERPKPPPKKNGQMILFALPTLVICLGGAVGIITLRNNAYDSLDACYAGIIATGGDTVAVGALGFHWEDDRPEAARVALEFVAERSRSPRYTARLARLLATSDTTAAHHYLQRAEERVADWKYVPPWLRGLIDSARARLGLEPRAW